jgi:hypothetical protein
MTSVTVTMRSYTERDSENTVAMKSYIGRDSGHDGEEGVTAGIKKKCAECDSDDKKLPKA